MNFEEETTALVDIISSTNGGDREDAIAWLDAHASNGFEQIVFEFTYSDRFRFSKAHELRFSDAEKEIVTALSPIERITSFGQCGVGMIVHFDENTTSGQGIFISRNFLKSVLLPLSAMSPFTEAEISLAMHLLAGNQLKQAAHIDNVSIETKRSQLKSITLKLNVSRQADVVRVLLSRALFSARYLGDQKTSEADATFFENFGKYMSTECPPPILITTQEGAKVRVLDIGPKDGKPVIALHPQIMPHISDHELRVLERHSIRLIFVFRSGSLAPNDKALSHEQAMESAINAIRCVGRQYFDKPFAILAMMSSAPYAIQACRDFPQLIERLVIVGACYKPETAFTKRGALRRGISTLAKKNSWMMSQAIKLLQSRLKNRDAFKSMLNSIYDGSSGDRQIIEWEFRSKKSLEAIQMKFLFSAESIKHDFYFQTFHNWKILCDLNLPVHFLHGASDPIHYSESVIKFSQTVQGATFSSVEGGQLLYGQFFDGVIGALADTLRNGDEKS